METRLTLPDSRRQVGGGIAEFDKNSRLIEAASSCLPLECGQLGPDCAVHSHQVRYVRPYRMPYEHVAQLAHDPLNRACVYVDIRPGKITHRSKNAMRYGVADEPGMPPGIETAPTNRQPKFEGHIETRRTRSSAGKLHSREIVNGVKTLMQERLNAI